MAQVWHSYGGDTAALWAWDNGDLPIWMTFDAIEALREARQLGADERRHAQHELERHHRALEGDHDRARGQVELRHSQINFTFGLVGETGRELHAGVEIGLAFQLDRQVAPTLEFA